MSAASPTEAVKVDVAVWLRKDVHTFIPICVAISFLVYLAVLLLTYLSCRRSQPKSILHPVADNGTHGCLGQATVLTINTKKGTAPQCINISATFTSCSETHTVQLPQYVDLFRNRNDTCFLVRLPETMREIKEIDLVLDVDSQQKPWYIRHIYLHSLTQGWRIGFEYDAAILLKKNCKCNMHLSHPVCKVKRSLAEKISLAFREYHVWGAVFGRRRQLVTFTSTFIVSMLACFIWSLMLLILLIMIKILGSNVSAYRVDSNLIIVICAGTLILTILFWILEAMLRSIRGQCYEMSPQEECVTGTFQSDCQDVKSYGSTNQVGIQPVLSQYSQLAPQLSEVPSQHPPLIAIQSSVAVQSSVPAQPSVATQPSVAAQPSFRPPPCQTATFTPRLMEPPSCQPVRNNELPNQIRLRQFSPASFMKPKGVTGGPEVADQHMNDGVACSTYGPTMIAHADLYRIPTQSPFVVPFSESLQPRSITTTAGHRGGPLTFTQKSGCTTRPTPWLPTTCNDKSPIRMLKSAFSKLVGSNPRHKGNVLHGRMPDPLPTCQSFQPYVHQAYPNQGTPRRSEDGFSIQPGAERDTARYVKNKDLFAHGVAPKLQNVVGNLMVSLQRAGGDLTGRQAQKSKNFNQDIDDDEEEEEEEEEEEGDESQNNNETKNNSSVLNHSSNLMMNRDILNQAVQLEIVNAVQKRQSMRGNENGSNIQIGENVYQRSKTPSQTLQYNNNAQQRPITPIQTRNTSGIDLPGEGNLMFEDKKESQKFALQSQFAFSLINKICDMVFDHPQYHLEEEEFITLEKNTLLALYQVLDIDYQSLDSQDHLRGNRASEECRTQKNTIHLSSQKNAFIEAKGKGALERISTDRLRKLEEISRCLGVRPDYSTLLATRDDALSFVETEIFGTQGGPDFVIDLSKIAHMLKVKNAKLITRDLISNLKTIMEQIAAITFSHYVESGEGSFERKKQETKQAVVTVLRERYIDLVRREVYKSQTLEFEFGPQALSSLFADVIDHCGPIRTRDLTAPFAVKYSEGDNTNNSAIDHLTKGGLGVFGEDAINDADLVSDIHSLLMSRVQILLAGKLTQATEKQLEYVRTTAVARYLVSCVLQAARDRFTLNSEGTQGNNDAAGTQEKCLDEALNDVAAQVSLWISQGSQAHADMMVKPDMGGCAPTQAALLKPPSQQHAGDRSLNNPQSAMTIGSAMQGPTAVDRNDMQSGLPRSCADDTQPLIGHPKCKGDSAWKGTQRKIKFDACMAGSTCRGGRNGTCMCYCCGRYFQFDTQNALLLEIEREMLGESCRPLPSGFLGVLSVIMLGIAAGTLAGSVIYGFDASAILGHEWLLVLMVIILLHIAVLEPIKAILVSIIAASEEDFIIT